MFSRRALGVLFFISMASLTSFAQQQPGGPGDRPDFSKFKEMMDQRMKEAMGSTDDEWAVLKPKIEKVQTLQRQSANIGGMMMMFGGGRPGGGRGNPFANPDEKPSAVEEKSADLNKSLQNKDATPDELKEKLAALREARVKSKDDIKKAQDELRDVVSVRQEATLVMMGTLE